MSINPNNLAETAVLTFADEFDGTSLDLSTWDTAYPWSAPNGGTNTANAEEQWYVRADYAPTAGLNVYDVGDGVLDINATPTPAGMRDDVDGYDYVSGMINTHGTFSQTYGYFEMRADIPEGQGLWPAFWLLQDDLSWPPELDVVEVIGSSPDDIITSVHSDAGGYQLLNDVTTIPGVSDGMHTFGMDWQPDEIVWYVDGTEVFRADTPDDMHDPMYLLANLAVGGTWPGSPTSESIPATLSIDYIRAYAELPEGAAPPPVQDEAPAPVPADPVDEAPVEDEAPAPAPADPVEPEPEPTNADRFSDWLDRLQGRDWFADIGDFGRGCGRDANERAGMRDQSGEGFGRFEARGQNDDRGSDGFGFASERVADRFDGRNELFDGLAERIGRFDRFDRGDRETGSGRPEAREAFDFASLDVPSADDVAGLVSSFLDVA